ncbi:MAG: hypothetical protein D8M58_13815 [Calditrichaeota bacterium]|nr:MAG: hypothetical protein DWQ03_15055 [Calditrichota bacterium]MBL1206477.1 hypothetical protein [Calditrichota bacterium]NOG46304.1 hypothetical protein [Calditrichota bacterium]
MNDQLVRPEHKIRIIIGIIISLTIAAVHAFRIGSYLDGDLYILYYSYASDIIIPFGFYFLLVISETEVRFLQRWFIKAFIVFGAATFTEIMQAFDYYFLGVTYDPVDILMFAIGTLTAVFFDKFIFERFLPNWKIES